jgi:hypothetical protein
MNRLTTRFGNHFVVSSEQKERQMGLFGKSNSKGAKAKAAAGIAAALFSKPSSGKMFKEHGERRLRDQPAKVERAMGGRRDTFSSRNK